MLEALKQRVYKANMALKSEGLVVLTWGNASAYDPDTELVVIKPSGVAYDTMTPNDMVVVDLDGRVVEGVLNPSSDTPTHIRLYQRYPELRGIVHTHSKWATVFAQAGLGINPLGTTHADYFEDVIPVTKRMSQSQIDTAYEHHTAVVIEEALKDTQPLKTPAVLVKEHGPFTFGASVEDALMHAVVLEEVAFMAYHAKMINQSLTRMDHKLQQKHYQRKHGKNAYYGQKK